MKQYSSTNHLHHPQLRPLRVQRRKATGPSIGDFDQRRSEELVHRGLAMRNQQRVCPGIVVDEDVAITDALRELAAVQFIENNVLNAARHAVERHAAEAPSDAGGLITWLESLRIAGPGQLDPLLEWLSSFASEEALRWYVQQELASEVGIRKLTSSIAALGRDPGKVSGLSEIASLMGVAPPATMDGFAWEALARSNLLIALASNRRWSSQAVGALVAVMMTSPARVMAIDAALTRLGYKVYPPSLPYDASKVATVVRKQLAVEPMSARAVARGALMWMHASVRCQSRYRAHLVSPAQNAL